METTGLYILGGFTASMVILAIILNLGKKFHDDEQAKKSSLNKC